VLTQTSSKVSKWHSTASTHKYPYQSPYDRPSNQRPPSGFNRPNRPGPSTNQYYPDPDEDFNNDDDYYSNNHGVYERPFNRPPSFQHHYENYDYNNNNHAPDNHYQHSSHIQSTSGQQYGHGHGHGHGGNYQYQHQQSSSGYQGGPRPWQPEIIVDDHAPEFPHPPQPSSYPQRPNPNDYHYNYMKQKPGRKPVTYPNSNYSNGEWVLLSTTKGYQVPRKKNQRAMSFKAQNGVATHSNFQPNKTPGIITSSSNKYESVYPPALYSGPTVTTQQKGIKLSVLPLYTDENQPDGSVSLYKPPDRDDPYHGMIEVAPSTETIEESVSAAAQANEQNSIASNKIGKKKKRKNYGLMRRQSGDTTSSVLAAVGAGNFC
jgi:hypothetical protein